MTHNRLPTGQVDSVFHFTRVALVLLAGVAGAPAAVGNDIFIAQSKAGLTNGQDCANAKDVTYFNTAANWVATTPIGNQIGPGSTVHLCGTFIGTPGASLLRVEGNGTAGNPISIQFEPGAQLNAPYWGGYPGGSCPCSGAITINGHHSIVIDGGKTGLIQNTANGSALAYSHDSLGIYINGSDITVRGLTIQNMYQNNGVSAFASDANGQYTANIRVDNGSSQISIYNNVLTNARAGIWSDSSGTVNYYNNLIADHCWQIVLNGSGSPLVYTNDISDYANWQFPTNAYHTDGVIAFGDSSIIRPMIYDNTFHGDLGQGSPTGFVFCTYGIPGNGSGSSCTIFNNVFLGTGYSAMNDMAVYFHSGDGTNQLGPHRIYNNTFSGFGFQIYMETDPYTTYDITNNVFVGGPATWFIAGNSNTFSRLTMNHNYFSGGRQFGPWIWNSSTFTTLAAWRTACNCDLASLIGNPNLNAQFVPQSGSPVIGLGVSLANSGIPALSFDKGGVARGTSGTCATGVGVCWDTGAYNFVGSAGAIAPMPPTNMTLTVK